MLEFLGSQTILEQWQGKTLLERTALFNDKYAPVHISVSTLISAYRKLGIKRKKVREGKAAPEKSKDYIRRQTRFAKDFLEQALKEKREIVWLDDTMFTRPLFQDTEWSARKTNFGVNQFTLQVTTKAFIGAISAEQGMVYYELYDKSINKPKFWAYLETLKKKMRGRDWILYLDNLKVHTCQESREYMEKLGIRWVWAPVYSPELNAIEFYFSFLKARVKRQRLQDMVREKKVSYDELVAKAVNEIGKEKIENCVDHVLKIFKLK